MTDVDTVLQLRPLNGNSRPMRGRKNTYRVADIAIRMPTNPDEAIAVASIIGNPFFRDRFARVPLSLIPRKK